MSHASPHGTHGEALHTGAEQEGRHVQHIKFSCIAPRRGSHALQHVWEVCFWACIATEIAGVAHAQTVLEHGGSFAGVNRKVQLKPLRWAPPEPGAPASEAPRIVEALLILKHGGVLTHAGRQQVRQRCCGCCPCCCAAVMAACRA